MRSRISTTIKTCSINICLLWSECTHFPASTKGRKGASPSTLLFFLKGIRTVIRCFQGNMKRFHFTKFAITFLLATTAYSASVVPKDSFNLALNTTSRSFAKCPLAIFTNGKVARRACGILGCRRKRLGRRSFRCANKNYPIKKKFKVGDCRVTVRIKRCELEAKCECDGDVIDDFEVRASGSNNICWSLCTVSRIESALPGCRKPVSVMGLVLATNNLLCARICAFPFARADC